MAYVEPKAPGFLWGLGTISGAGTAGQCVRVAGNNVFAVNDDGDERSFGVLAKTYKDGEMCGVHCLGGIYETDQYAGAPVAGDVLVCDAETGKLTPQDDETAVVAEALSVEGGVLRFKLLV